jgi:hypothetical protein
MSFRLFSLEVFIEHAGAAWPLLDFDYVRHDERNREAWGLGLHVVVSRL